MSNERRTAVYATLSPALLVAQQVVLKASRDALFLSGFGVSALPLATAASAVLSALMLFVYSRALTRRSPARALPWILGIGSALLAIEWMAGLRSAPLGAVLVYAHSALFGGAVLSAFWSAVNEAFDPNAARRYIGWITAGAGLGGALGGLIAFVAASHVNGFHLLVLAIGLAVTASAALRGMDAPEASTEGRKTWTLAEPFRQLRETTLLRQLGLIVLLVALLEVLLDYTVSVEANASLGTGPRLLRFFAIVHVITGLGSLLLQIVLARRSLERFGPVGTLVLLPLATLTLGAGALLSPGLVAATLPRTASAIARASFFRSAYELLFAPMEDHQKRSAKVVLDVGFDRVGTLLGSGLVAIVVATTAATARASLLAALVVALLLAAAVWPLGASYLRTLGHVLSRRTAAPYDLDGLALSRTRDEIGRAELLRRLELSRRDADGAQAKGLADLADLRSGDIARVRAALGRVEQLDGTARAELIALLGDPCFHADAERAIGRIATRMTGLLSDSFAETTRDRAVRRRIARILGAAGDRRALDSLLAGLEDDDEALRRASAAALVRMTRRDRLAVIPEGRILEAIARALADLRTDTNGLPSERRLAHLFALFALVLGPDAPLEASLKAVLSTDVKMRGTALEYLHEALPARVRLEAWPLLQAAAREELAPDSMLPAPRA